MKSGSEHYCELLERRLELLHALRRLEGEWRRAFIALDMQASEHVAADEEAVCQQVHRVDREIASLGASKFKGTSSVPVGSQISSLKSIETDLVQSKIRAALDKMAASHEDLRHSNQIRRAILRRSNLTIHALRNLFNSYAPTYAAPAAPGTGAIYEENV